MTSIHSHTNHKLLKLWVETTAASVCNWLIMWCLLSWFSLPSINIHTCSNLSGEYSEQLGQCTSSYSRWCMFSSWWTWGELDGPFTKVLFNLEDENQWCRSITNISPVGDRHGWANITFFFQSQSYLNPINLRHATSACGINWWPGLNFYYAWETS